MLLPEPCVFGDDRLTVTLTPSHQSPGVDVTLAARGWRSERRAPLARATIIDCRMPRIESCPKLALAACEHVAHGVHLTLVDVEHALEIGLWLRVRDGELRVLVPPAEVREEFGSLFRLAAVDLLPGLVTVAEEGELLLPLTTGLTVSPAGKPALCDRFLLGGEQERWELMTQLPACAGADIGGGLVLLATQGVEDMRCEVATHGDGRGHVGFAAVWRDHFSDPVDVGHREVVYVPVAAGTRLLTTTARRVRRHVMEDLGKTPLAERAAEHPAVAALMQGAVCKLFFGGQRQGAMWSNGPRAGQVGQPLFHRAMTFEQAAAGLSRLKAAGVDLLVTESVGWNFRGHDGLYPTRLPIDERLGGEAGFRALLDTGRALGYRMSVHDNFLDAYLDSPDLDPSLLVHDLDGAVRITGYWGGGLKASYWGTAVPADFIRGHLTALCDLGVDGPIYLDAMGSPSMCNYHPRHRGPRRGFAEGQARLLTEARAMFGGVSTEVGYQFAMLPTDCVAGGGGGAMARWSPDWDITAMGGTRVPLWNLVWQGLVALGGHGETWPATMQALLFGLIPHIEWCATPNGPVSALDDAMVAAFAAKYDLCARRFGHLRTQPLVDWQSSTPGVEITRFADGTEVYADFEQRELRIDGKPIACPDALPLPPPTHTAACAEATVG